MTGYQKFVVALLAFLQFTVILDFMIMSPLGAIIMPTLKIEPSQFGLLVSVYAFSAGTAGLLASGFTDRFDRKKLLLFFYAGFVAGTFLCAIATSYHFLLVARMVTGLFGGVIGSIVFAITTKSMSGVHVSMYALSSAIHSSNEICERPEICHKQVTPGLTDSRRRATSLSLAMTVPSVSSDLLM